jgi:hypothetical protein
MVAGFELDGGQLAGFLNAVLLRLSEVALFCLAAVYVMMVAFAVFAASFANKKERRAAAMEVLRTLLWRRRGK